MRLSIAKHIRSLRKRAGLTQEELAQRLYVTRQTVSLWELGKTRPDVETLQAIADCLGWICSRCSTDRSRLRPRAPHAGLSYGRR